MSGEVPAWLLGRIAEGRPELVLSVVFGQFSDAALPPTR